MALIQFSGLASGIDSAGLIEAIIDQKRASRITPLEDKVAEFEDTKSALEELNTLMLDLKNSASGFRLINGGGIARFAQSSDETVVTAAASNAATPGSYEITATTLAKNGTLSFDDRFTSTGDAIYSGMNDGAAAADRTVSYTIGTSDPETVDIELTSTTTVSQFISEFNSKSTRASASAVNVGTTDSPSYAIVIRSNETGLEEGQLGVSVGSAVTDGGGGAFNANTLDQATDAALSVSGISGTITRSSNTISDVLSGVTVTLQDTGTSVLTVQSDADTTASALEDFVDSFNKLAQFIRENDLVIQEEDSEGTTNIFGPLASTSVDNNALSAIRNALSGSKGSGGAANILADIGITTERDGSLKFDIEVFKDVLSSDPNGVQTLLENIGERLAAPAASIDQFTRFNGLIDVTNNGLDSQIANLNDRISLYESQLLKEEEALTARFARLESVIGGLQQQQNALAGILPTG